MKTSTKILIIGGSILTASTAYKAFIVSHLKYFSPSEFGSSLPFLNVNLLKNLDKFRYLVNPNPDIPVVIISPASGSLYRKPNLGNESQHCLGRAADVFVNSSLPINELVERAKQAGFSGIGIYPDWNYNKYPNAKGMHLDVRTSRTPDNPALWGMIRNAEGKQVEVAFNTALQRFA